MSFIEEFSRYSWQQISEEIYSKNANDVELALSKTSKRNINDFMALISPAAEPYLEQMAQLSQQLTQKRFGKTIQMYIPLYLSNKCHNICTYCGFSANNKIKRVSLKRDAILAEAEVIRSYGYDHVLLVTGETSKIAVDYLAEAIDSLSPHFANISMETQPFEQKEYEYLISKGLHAVLVYQETYNKERYPHYHLSGNKSDFNYRLESHDRLGAAGIHKMGLGALLGLEDWRVDTSFVALHLSYLEKKYWKTKFSISFPRLRPAEGFKPNVVMSDRQLVQLICAYRIFNENVELSLSTRERPQFREHAIKLGVTTVSAGSKTSPGGYVNGEALEQFSISDDRSAAEVAQMIKQQGYEAVWKDWERGL